MMKKKVDLLISPSHELEIIEAYIKRYSVDKSTIRILEAGCGQKWPLKLRGIKYLLEGVDIDKNALEIRENKLKDLDKSILGDLRYIDLKENEYDVIYSSYVLEHIQNAKLVLNNFNRWLKPGGILILKIPDRNSVFGFITRITPLWFHIFYYKYIWGVRHAGKLGFGPYPTVYESVISREGIHKYCQSCQFIIKAEYGQSYYLLKPGVAQLLTRLFVRIISLLSFGRLRWEYAGLTFILKKGYEA
jgi:SAM-dependent methyltransferase